MEWKKFSSVEMTKKRPGLRSVALRRPVKLAAHHSPDCAGRQLSSGAVVRRSVPAHHKAPGGVVLRSIAGTKDSNDVWFNQKGFFSWKQEKNYHESQNIFIKQCMMYSHKCDIFMWFLKLKGFFIMDYYIFQPHWRKVPFPDKPLLSFRL